MVYYPYEPTKWSEELAKVYDRQSRQLEEHHANLRERDRQLVQKTQNESIVKLFGKLSEFSQSAGSLYKAHKARKAGEKLEFNKDFLNLVRTNPKFKSNLEKIYEENKLDTVKLGEKLEAFIKSERENGRFDKVKYLDRFNPKKMLQTREAIAIALAPTAIGDIAWDVHVNKLDFASTEERAAFKNNPGNRDEWAQGEIANISNNEPFATKFLFEEYDRKTSTNKNVRQTRDAAELNRLTEARSDAILKTSGTSLKPKIFAENIFTEVTSEINSGKYTQVENGPTVQEQAVEAVVQRIENIGFRGAIPNSALAGLEEKLTAAGSITQSYFSKDGDHYNRIVRAVNGGQNRWLAGEKANDEALAVDLKRRRLDGEDVTRELQHLRSRGLVSDETIKGVEKINTADNTQDAYKDESKYWNKSMQNGTLLTKENVDLAKEIKNEKLKDEVLAEQEKLQASYNLNGFDSYDKRQRANGSLIMKQSQNRTLGENEVLEGFNERLQDEITNLESKLYAYYYNLNPEDSQIGIKVAIDKKKILNDNGFYAQPGDANEGIYTKDSNGNFTNYQNSLIGKVQVSKLPTERNRTIWSSNLYNVWERASNDFTLTGDTVKERVLNTLNSTLTPQDIIGIFESGEISDKLMYTAELFPDTNETEILIGATKALIASKDKEHQQIVKGFKLEEKLKNIPTVQLELKDKIKSLNDFDLNGIIDRGLQNASPKEKIRLYAKLLEIADKSNEETAEMNSN